MSPQCVICMWPYYRMQRHTVSTNWARRIEVCVIFKEAGSWSILKKDVIAAQFMCLTAKTMTVTIPGHITLQKSTPALQPCPPAAVRADKVLPMLEDFFFVHLVTYGTEGSLWHLPTILFFTLPPTGLPLSEKWRWKIVSTVCLDTGTQPPRRRATCWVKMAERCYLPARRMWMWWLRGGERQERLIGTTSSTCVHLAAHSNGRKWQTVWLHHCKLLGVSLKLMNYNQCILTLYSNIFSQTPETNTF